MPKSKPVQVSDGDVVILAGTLKGLFILRSDAKRGTWDVGGPHFPGAAVYAAAYDGRAGKQRIWAAASSMHWGSVLHASDDFGKRWTEPKTAPVRFPKSTGQSLRQIWQIAPGLESEPNRMFVGVEPAALFESRDDGKSFNLVQGLFDHPHRPKWVPGGGGLCLHTVEPHPTDPDRMHIAISAAGVYRTEDGGKSWRTAHKGVRAEFLPNKHPEFGQCVHKIVRHPEKPERLFLQNHWGLYRSDDEGGSWKDIANGVPSDFGFAMAIHPSEPETVFIVPLEGDFFRCTPGGKLRVFRTKNGGKSWQALGKGLPQEHAFETVLRDGMCTDGMSPAGIYFGTRSGKLFGSRDDGDSWKLLVDGLPPVACVRAFRVGAGAKAGARSKARKATGRTSARA